MFCGCTVTQAGSRRLHTAAARVRAGVRSCEICGGQSDTGAAFLRILPNAPHSSSSIIRGCQIVAEIPSGPRLTPPQVTKTTFVFCVTYEPRNWSNDSVYLSGLLALPNVYCSKRTHCVWNWVYCCPRTKWCMVSAQFPVSIESTSPDTQLSQNCMWLITDSMFDSREIILSLCILVMNVRFVLSLQLKNCIPFRWASRRSSHSIASVESQMRHLRAMYSFLENAWPSRFYYPTLLIFKIWK
jgi:hypothetical protein